MVSMHWAQAPASLLASTCAASGRQAHASDHNSKTAFFYVAWLRQGLNAAMRMYVGKWRTVSPKAGSTPLCVCRRIMCVAPTCTCIRMANPYYISTLQAKSKDPPFFMYAGTYGVESNQSVWRERIACLMESSLSLLSLPLSSSTMNWDVSQPYPCSS